MNKFIGFLGVLLLLTSCVQPPREKVPANIINPDDMVKIYRDIHLTDAYIANQKLRINIDYIKINGYYNSITEKYGYSRTKIDSSMNYYSHHPELMNEIYDIVLTDLSKMEDTVGTKK